VLSGSGPNRALDSRSAGESQSVADSISVTLSVLGYSLLERVIFTGPSSPDATSLESAL